jgi:hypothetical protein
MNTAPDGSSGLGGGDAGAASDAGGAGDTGSVGDAASALDAGGAADARGLGDASLPSKDACATGTPVAFPGAVGFGAPPTM